MKDTYKLFLRCIQISLIVAIPVGWIFHALQPDPKHFYYGSVIKANLLKNVSSPRIIIVGGSNLGLGVDSEMMEKELGIPVINDGMDVHLGIASVQEVKDYIQPNDVIVISLEYYNYTDEATFYGSPQYLSDWIEISPRRIWYLHDPIHEMPFIFITMLQRKVNRQINFYLYGDSLDPFRGVYTGDNFNAHGDFIGHLDDNNQTQVENSDTIYPVNDLVDADNFLKEFNQYALSKGATVFYEAQASRQTNCELTGMKNMRSFYRRLEKNSSIPLLTKLDQLCLPDDFFYDTPYHLNKQGRTVRTERLIENLKFALDLGEFAR
jgi:hypothetical protein